MHRIHIYFQPFHSRRILWRTLALLLLAVLFFQNSNAQVNVKIRRAKFKKEHEGFRDAWNSIKSADESFVLGMGMYWKAREGYLKAYAYNPDNAELNYKLGACYLMTDDKFKAMQYLKRSFQLNPRVSPDIHFLLGRASHLVLHFDSAILEYRFYRNTLRHKELKSRYAEIDKLIQECNYGKVLVDSPVRVIITNLGDQVNSAFDDYNSVIISNDSLLYFTSRRPANKKSKPLKLDFKFPEDIYVAHIDSSRWTGAKNLGKPVNTEHNDAVVAVGDNGQKLYVYNGFRNGGDIRVCVFRKGRFSRPKKISGRIRSKYHESAFCIAPDTSAVYFVSNMHKDNLGGKDIYMCRIKPNGRWTRPENLGNQINTPYDEEGVSISKNGKTLFFSSKGHNSMGGYDIFKSTKDSTGHWTKPVNLGYPINSPDDELFYYEAPDNPRFGYYSAIRDGGLGGKDIYKVTYLGETKEPVMTTDEQLYAWPYEMPPSIFFTKPSFISIDTSLVLQGRVLDAKTMEPVVARINLIDNDKSQVTATSISDTAGNYKLNLPSKKVYGVEISAKDYLLFLENLDLKKDSSDLVIHHDFTLSKVEVGVKVVLKNIFFETGKATLKPESYPELGNVIKFLTDNPTVQLEISGHTDNVGSLKTNTRLSQDRAQSVVNYLVSKGVASSRLQAKGYAFSQPIASNDTPDGRAQNRRVEFKVLSK